MNKEQEIQELERLVCPWGYNFSYETCSECEYYHLTFEEEEDTCDLDCAVEARKIYNAGYRKADEVREETAKVILKEVGDKVTYYEGEGSVFYERKPEWYYELCKKFGYKAE